jgi:hypothetical protein
MLGDVVALLFGSPSLARVVAWQRPGSACSINFEASTHRPAKNCTTAVPVQ